MRREIFESPSQYIKRLAKKIRSNYENNSLRDICDEENIYLSSYDLGDINGYYFEFNDVHIIKYNNSLDDRESIQVIAHELGHYYLHRNLDIFFIQKNTLLLKNRYEIEADLFAAELIISDSVINEYKGYSVDQLSKILGLKKELIDLKINNM